MEKLVGMLGGQRVGRTDHQGYSLLIYIYTVYSISIELKKNRTISPNTTFPNFVLPVEVLLQKKSATLEGSSGLKKG